MSIWWGLAALVVGTPLVASHCGRWHPAGDAFAVLRPGLAALCLVVLGAGYVAGGVAAPWLALPLVSAATVVWPLLRPHPRAPGTMTLYQKNLSFQLQDPAALIADIRAIDPDVITLQEVSAENETLLQALSDRWPHQQLCPHAPVGGVAVLSRHPATGEADRLCATSLAGLRIRTPAGPLWVVALHLPWPWPFGQALYSARACAALSRLDGPVVLAGDFNMVPWSHTLHRFMTVTGARRAGRALGTFPMGRVRLPIDHCLAPRPARSERRPLCGSDHHGLVVRF